MDEHDDQPDGSEQYPGSEPADYTEEELAAFGVWVELGARDPRQQPLLEIGLSGRWERREPSGSGWVIRLLRDPITVLVREEKVPGMTEDSNITTTILHHERGLGRRVIVVTATVERASGDTSLVIDKETG